MDKMSGFGMQTVTCESSSPCRLRAVILLTLLSLLSSGCASFSNPVANGVPVQLLPPELLAEPKEQLEAIPFVWLRRPTVDEYRLGPGDVLGIYADGIFGDRTTTPPTVLSQTSDRPPAVGLPHPVRPDGTISLPLLPPVRVAGMTIEEVEREIVEAYEVKRKFINSERDRVIVTLMFPRREQVLVIREDTQDARPNTSDFGALSRFNRVSLEERGENSGQTVGLPAYENDLLHALTATGGLPGLDAENEVIIQRGGFRKDPSTGDALYAPADTVRIPLRIRPGSPIPFAPSDIILHSGDVIYIRRRTTDFYFTGGLLPAQEVPLPRDRDLNVVEAITRIGGPVLNGGLNASNLAGGIVAAGIGNPSPSLLSVLRTTVDGRQVNIRVDLNLALRDPRENILLQAGDVVLLQETRGEAFARYVTNAFTLNFFTEMFRGGSGFGAASASLP